MEKKFVITDEAGLHARPATVVVNTASNYDSDIYLEYKGRRVNLKSIMGVMSLGVPRGGEITVIVEGGDEEAAMEGIENALRERGLID
ncbi:MAG TPA: phosphocarrier protein HPr [Haloplasmataceae bacterium]